jgi:hypothetical protein
MPLSLIRKKKNLLVRENILGKVSTTAAERGREKRWGKINFSPGENPRLEKRKKDKDSRFFKYKKEKEASWTEEGGGVGREEYNRKWV